MGSPPIGAVSRLVMDPVVKPHDIRDLGEVDVTAVRQQVARLSETVWNVHDASKENQFEVLGRTRHIVFRFFHPDQDPRDFTTHPIWNVWRGALVPVLTTVASAYGYAHPEFPKVMLASLPAGGTIQRHTDGAGGNLLVHKIHVPLETNPAVTFLIRDQPFHLDIGRAYEVNNIAPHGGANRGSSARIHLIFELFDDTSRA